MKNVLIIAAHPDDEVLGCGGSIARYVKEGHTVFLLIIGEGVTSRDNKRVPAQRKHELLFLKEQARTAGKLLGVEETSFGDLPDNRFDSLDLLDIVKLIEKHIKKTTPDVIFTHGGGDLNIDHTITHRAVLTATRPLPGQSVKEIYAFEIPSSTEWAFQQFSPVFRPSVFIDIKDTLETKIKAIKTYDKELRPSPHPRSVEAITALARYRGSSVGLAAAEAFEVIRVLVPGGTRLDISSIDNNGRSLRTDQGRDRKKRSGN